MQNGHVEPIMITQWRNFRMPRTTSCVASLYFLVASAILLNLACSPQFSPRAADMLGDDSRLLGDHPQNPLEILEIDPDQASSELEYDLIELAKEKVDPSISRQDSTPSLVLGVVTRDFSHVYSLGASPQGVRPNMRSLYPISSVSKMLTGLIAATAIKKGLFSGETLVRSVIRPELASLVDSRLTIDHLLSHHGGFEAMPKNLNSGNPLSPAFGYSMEDLTACLEYLCPRIGLPGEKYQYSNLGLGLLAVALGDGLDTTDYSELLALWLTDPVGMKDTILSRHILTIDPNRYRIIAGIGEGGREVDPAQMGVLSGAGEVVSTAFDMVLLLQSLVFMEPGSSADLATREIASINSTHAMAAGFDISKDRPYLLYYKGGSQPGYSSFIVWSSELGAGIVLLSNRGSFSSHTKDLSFRLIDRIASAQL